MFLSYQPQFIFVHIPKTAGTSISECLRTVAHGKIEQGCLTCDWDHHTTARQFQSRLQDYDKYFTFSFVRNPWDWMYSWYTFHSQMNNELGKEVSQHDFKWWLMEFKHIMENSHMDNEPIVPSQRRGQLDWLTDKNGNIIVNFVGKFETLENDFNVVRDKLKIKKALPVRNASRHSTYKSAYDNEMIEFVYKFCKKDIEEFGYEF